MKLLGCLVAELLGWGGSTLLAGLTFGQLAVRRGV